MEQFYNITGIISVLLLTVAFIFGIRKCRFVTKNERWFVYYIFFISFIEWISYTISFFKISGGKSTLYPIYIAGEFFMVTGIFMKKLNLPNYYFILTGTLSLFFLNADKILPRYDNDYSKAISNLIIIAFAGYSLLQEIIKGDGKNRFLIIEKMIFLYFSVSIFIFLFQHQLFKFPVEYFSAIWVINNLMICILYSFFIKIFLKLKK